MFEQLKRLAKHSAIYGLGGVVSRLVAVLLLPVYTRYLTPRDYGAVEVLVAGSAVLAEVLRLGIRSAFFRFYFDSTDAERRRLVVRTAFWFTMASATAGLLVGLAAAGPISEALFATGRYTNLVRAAFVALWAAMNYAQLTSLYRAEERSVSYSLASLANVVITIGATVLLVVVFRQGATGVMVGNFAGTLAVYAVLLVARREQLGLQFDRALFREMNRFGMPLVPSGIALWVINFSDRFFLVKLAGAAEVGLYSIGVRISMALVLVLTAFRTAWAAFGHSIRDDDEARRTYAAVLTYLMYLACWLALGLALVSPWLVRLLTQPDFYAGSRVVAPLAFAAAAFGGYLVVWIGVARARRTQFNWVVAGIAAAVNVALNVALIPPFGMMGAAVATLGAYVALFAGMAWTAQRAFPVPYEWRRVTLLAGAAVGLTVVGKLLDVSLLGALLLSAAYPLVLLPLGFYLPAELRRMRAAGRRFLALAR